VDVGSDSCRLSHDQWARVKDIFREALERPAAGRKAFIGEACEGDAALEAALESLLASDDSAREFLETPAVARVGLPSHMTATLVPGDRLGAYEIVELLGVGGMGEVYRARDARLERDVALKVLPAHVMNDAVRRRWLELEARAAAALDDPNICPIFDIGEQDGRVWIAMQFVEGETLAERLKRGPLTLSTALEIATQIAGALSAAHARGIVHRDVKPENVMITAAGHAKVLDFGLAKIAAEHGMDTHYSGQSGVHSRRLGTLPYMSPEQLRGESLDARTDVFSLSVVLYEMVTGRRPFLGDGDAEIRTGILSATPPAVSVLSAAADPALDRVARKGLQKDRAARYQTMSDLAADLEDVKRRLEITSQRIDARMWVAGGALAAIVVGLIAASLWSSSRQQTTNNSTRPLEYVQLTNFPDSVRSPALSADAKLLAFVREAQSGGGQDLYIKELPDGQPRRLTNDGGIKIRPTFSPDGSIIVYQRGLTGSTFAVPVAGGAPSLFMSNATGLRWIGPNELLFSQMKEAPHMGVVATHQDGAHVRDVYLPASPLGMAHFSERSPDGSQVLVVEMDRGTGWLPCRLVPFDGSSTGRRVGPAPAECTAASWSPDGRWMYFTAAVNGESHIWRQRFPDGTPEQLTFEPNQESDTAAIDPDGKSLVAAIGAAQSTVWYHDEHGDRPVSIEGYAYRPLVSPDESKVLYLVRRLAKTSFSVGELWGTDLASGRNQRLLPGFLIRSYHLSADGKQMVFDSFDQSGGAGVWLAQVDGRHAPRRLIANGDLEELRPFLGASGDIYFMRRRGDGLAGLYRMRQDGSGRRRVADDIDFLVNISADEKWAAVWSFHGTKLISLDGSRSRGLCPCGIGPIIPGPPGVSWSRDRTTIVVDTGSHGGSGEGDGMDGTVLIPWEDLQRLPTDSIPSMADLSNLPGARRIPVSGVAPGQTATRYAFTRENQQTNLYRVHLP
jgi:serine/threonine protein kinase